MAPPAQSPGNTNSVKYQWARHVAREALQQQKQYITATLADLRINDPKTFEIITGQPPESLTLDEKTPLKVVAQKSKNRDFGDPPEAKGNFKVGIIGSGAAGMFTALLLDHINEKFKGKLKVDYDILEANKEDRVGGRLYTHRFTRDPKEHQYYDVGAMRFPKNKVMERTFKLFDYLGMHETGEDPALRRYYFQDVNNVCPSYYNDISKFGKPGFDDFVPPNSGIVKAEPKPPADPFQVNRWLPKDDPRRIPDSIIRFDPNDLMAEALKPLTEALKEDLRAKPPRRGSTTPGGDDGLPNPGKGWQKLMAADYMSVRQYLRSGLLQSAEGSSPDRESAQNLLPVLDYNFNTIEWFETYALATGWYDQSLAEQCLEEIDFETPKVVYPDGDQTKEPKDWFWFCVEGGAQLIAERMKKKLVKQPEFNKKVTAIKQNLLNEDGTGLGNGDVKVQVKGEKDPRTYFAVLSSAPLGALQRMDLSHAGLLYGTKQAIRSLRYGASCKVAIRFRKMWWMDEPFNITKAGLGKTDLPLRTCVYPSYNLGDDKQKPGVLLCSYTWAQDAQRIGTLISPESPANEEELKEQMLSNLAQLHAKPIPGYGHEDLLDKLRGLYMEHHAWDWYNDSNAVGAFAWFGPGQFSQMWPQIIQPNGWLFLTGEATSAHHGWVVGALESAVRAVYQMFLKLNQLQNNMDSKYTVYEEVLNFLEGPKDGQDKEWELPFVGLPHELPFRQLETEPGKDVSIVPGTSNDLSFLTAQEISSFLQLALEALAKPTAAGQAPPAPTPISEPVAA